MTNTELRKGMTALHVVVVVVGVGPVIKTYYNKPYFIGNSLLEYM